MNLPKGFHIHGNKLRFSFWNPAKKRPDNKSTGLPPTKEGIREAKRFRTQFLKELNAPAKKLVKDNQLLILSDGIKKYFIANEHLSKKTVQLCEYAVNHFIRIIGDKYLIDYTKEDSKNFNKIIKQERKAHNTISTFSKHLHSIFKFFVDEDYISNNPIITLPQVTKKPKAIKDDDLKLILDYLKNNNVYGYNIIYFLYLSGLRVGEAIELRWHHIDFKNNEMVFVNFKGSRNGNKRIDSLPLFKSLRDHLESFKPTNCSPEDRIFLYTNKSLSFYYRVQNSLFNERRYSIHQLRKTFITKLVNSPLAEDLNLVRELARHSKIGTTLQYYSETKKERMRKELNLKVDFSL